MTDVFMDIFTYIAAAVRTEYPGTFVTGEWVNAQRQGEGTMTWPDGSTYTGSWKNSKRNGHGVLHYGSDGSYYEGEFKNDKRHGEGTYYKADGSVVTGRWENDKLVEEYTLDDESIPELEIISVG